jgi:hypothetical protein
VDTEIGERSALIETVSLCSTICSQLTLCPPRMRY